MSLFRPFTIIFWEWKASDAQTLVQDNSQEYVYRFAHEWANIQYAFIIFILTKCCSTKIGKKTFSEREKMFSKNGAVFCILKNIRHWIIDFGSAVCPQIFILGIFYTKTFFPCSKGLDKELIFLAFFLHLPTMISMTKTENRDFVFIFQI